MSDCHCEHCHHTHEKNDALKDKLRFASLTVGAGVFAAALILPRREWSIAIFLLAYALIGGEILFNAIKNIFKGEIFDENFLMSLASVGAFVIGEYPEAVAVSLFYRIGESLQDRAVAKSTKSISDLTDIRPDYANVKTEDGTVRVSPETVSVGALIIIKPGERVPLDGVVTEGSSSLDVSALTGESVPVDVCAGGAVLSGSVNNSGLLEVKTTKAYAESTAARILALINGASEKKARTERFIRRFSRIYTPAVVFAALALSVIPTIFTGHFDVWLGRALVFLVASCPCALVISVPLAYFGGIGAASRKGILVKGTSYFDIMSEIKTVIFDKTGTLTKGAFSVAEIAPANGFTAQELLRAAAAAESGSTHPVGQCISERYARDFGKITAKVTNYTETAGKGVSATVDGVPVMAGNAAFLEQNGIKTGQTEAARTTVYAAIGGVYAGRVTAEDEIKADAARTVRELRERGVKNIVMLTGDAKAVGERTAKLVGIDAVFCELLPADKIERAEKYAADMYAFVGDGINDAPLLAQSAVGISMGGLSSDAAREAADVVLMTDEPSKIPELITIARFTKKIAAQNVAFALTVKSAVLALGAAGLAPMWAAVFADVGVCVLAVLNALRTTTKR